MSVFNFIDNLITMQRMQALTDNINYDKADVNI